MYLSLSCSNAGIDTYKDKTPELGVREFFTGDLVAYGIVRNRSGEVIRHFKAVLKGSWDDRGVGTLDEVFWFDDGERQTRIWTMTPDGLGHYIGTAGDVVGTAMIQTRGNAMHLEYDLQVPYKDDSIVLAMNDWMYQIVPGLVINETVMTKWGFEVGKLTLAIMKAEITDSIPDLVKQFELK